MILDEAVAFSNAGDGVFSGRTDGRYFSAGRAFGGYIAAALLAPVNARAPDGSTLLSLSAQFAAPPSDGAYRIVTRNVRRNRSTDFWTAHFEQGDESAADVKVNGALVFARRRATREFRVAAAPRVAPPEALLRFMGPQLPAFLALYDLRDIDDIEPGAGRMPAREVSRMWVRDEPARPLDALSLVAFCDTVVPPIFFRAGHPLATATVSLNVFFHADARELAAIGTDYVLTETTMRLATGGYFDASSTLWSRAGRLLATTEQLSYYNLP